MSRVTSRFIVFGNGADQVNAQLLPANYTPVNYTPSQVGSEGTNKVSAHLKGIDSAFLPKAGGTLTGAIGIVPGTVSSPGLFVAGSLTTGLYSPASNDLAVTTNGVQRLLLTDDGQLSLSVGMTVTSANTVTATGTYAVLATDLFVLVNTSAAVSIQLPNPSTRRVIYIKDANGLAETNNITLLRFGSENIEGLAANKLLQTNWGSWILVSNGTNWLMWA